MIVETIAVGTELLLGQIANTNAAAIGAALAEHGFDAHFTQVVGDNIERVATSIRTAIDRADAIIITGGIGPTKDDLTRESVCAATGRDMVISHEYAEHLERRWAARGRVMPESNLRQAEHPEGAHLLPNPKGTAPGLALDHEGTLIFCIPGVPQEMEHLLRNDVLPMMLERSGGPAVVVSRLIRTWGQSESAIGELLDDLYEGSTNPSVAFLASGGEIKIRITAKGDDAGAAERLIAPIADEVQRRLAGYVFGVDDQTIEVIIADELSKRGWTIATAESMTGGLVAAALTSTPGASRYVKGGVIAYQHDVKASVLGVGDITSVVNENTARQMAEGVRTTLGADVGVAITGSAGPDPMEQPPGTVVIAVSTPDNTMARTLRMPGDRERVRTFATTSAIHLTRLAITGQWWTT